MGDFIDRDRGSRNVNMLNEIFLPIDVDSIVKIPLSEGWQADRVVWHGSSKGQLTVKLAYHLIKQRSGSQTQVVVQIYRRRDEGNFRHYRFRLKLNYLHGDVVPGLFPLLIGLGPSFQISPCGVWCVGQWKRMTCMRY